MRFLPTELDGAFVVELEPATDERGSFARTFCARELEEHGLDATVAQCSISTNARRGTLRGIHYQRPPAAENKLVRCTRGSIWDVILDLRPDSPTYRRHFGIELSADDGRALYVPELVAHGFLTLTDQAEIFYMISEYYTPAAQAGVRWNDPAFGIEWPRPVEVISEKDASWPLWPDAS